MIFSLLHYPELKYFKDSFSEIKEELLNVVNKPLDEIYNSTWVGERPNYLTNPIDRNTAWKTYTFRFFGINHIPNMESCPIIREILAKYPSIVTAEFSLLEPHTHILPHRGYTNKLLRAHLGLIVPKGDVAIKVTDMVLKWEEGEVLIFDDSIEHEAWNKTDKQRVVFMFDFEPNFDAKKALEICQEILEKTTDSHVLNIAPRESWLQWVSDGKFPYLL